MLSQHHFWRPPNEDHVKIQRQAAREEEARIAKVVEFRVTKTNLFFWGEIKECKSMVGLRDSPVIMYCSG